MKPNFSYQKKKKMFTFSCRLRLGALNLKVLGLKGFQRGRCFCRDHLKKCSSKGFRLKKSCRFVVKQEVQKNTEIRVILSSPLDGIQSSLKV